MAEELKEFVNAAITAADFTGNEYTIVTNNATTQAVIKDVTASGLPATNIEVVNGTTVVANGGTLSGFELVEKSGSLKLKLNPAAAAGVLDVINVITVKGATTYNVHALKQLVGNTYPLKSSSVHVESFTEDSTTLPCSGMSDPTWLVINEANNRAYYFRYDGNSTTYLYHATYSSGTFGSWNYVTSGANTYEFKALDSYNQKIYWQYSADGVRVHDMATNTGTNYTAFAALTGNVTPTTYCDASAVNGVFFSRPNSSGGTTKIQFWEPSTGNAGIITGTYRPNSASSFMTVCYNPDEQMYYIFTKDAATSNLSSIKASSLALACTATSIVDNSPSVQTATDYASGSPNGYFVYVNGSGTMTIAKPSSAGFTSLYTSASTYDTKHGPVFSKPVATTIALSDLDIALNVKASGVEITGV